MIRLGCGSALDAAKVIAMLQRNPGSIREYLDPERVCQTKGLPVMAIPTTAGTGSEVTPFSVITHKAKRTKPAIAPPQNFPDVALVDPELTMSMPPSVTASTGLDALCQAVEGFWSTQGNPVGPGKPRGGIPAQGQGRRYPHDPREPSDRDRDVKAPAVEERFRELLQTLSLPGVEAFANRVEGLMEKVGAPRRLSEFGAKAEALPDIVKRGVGRSTAWNPRPMGEEDLLQICKSVL